MPADNKNMSHRFVIISDLHGRRAHAERVLREAGVIDGLGNRLPNVTTIAVGDIVSLGYDEIEIGFLEWIWPLLDIKLFGNHDLHPVWFNTHDMAFWGYSPEKDEKTNEQIFVTGADPEAVAFIREHAGEMQAAAWVGNWLITHAGVHPRYQQMYLRAEATAEDVAWDLNDRLARCLRDRRYDDVITRTATTDGGIFWLRADNLDASYDETYLPQIVGHTPTAGPREFRENLWCIDTPGGVAALVTDDVGKSFTLVTSMPED